MKTTTLKTWFAPLAMLLCCTSALGYDLRLKELNITLQTIQTKPLLSLKENTPAMLSFRILSPIMKSVIM